MSTLTSEFLTGVILPTTPRGEGRPRRDVRLEAMAGTSLMVAAMSQGVAGYAGDDENPRPPRPRSLYDVKKWIADYFDVGRYRRALPEDTLYFSFCHNRMSMPLEEAVPVSREDLWLLAAPGDILLLSDRRTHHYIDVYRVDTDADRIYLLDPWPERVFLKKGLNAAGVEAVVEAMAPDSEKPLWTVSISRSEFLRVILGIITWDTPDLIDYYLTIRPTQREQLETQLAFGLTLMEAENYTLARFAVEHLHAALRLAESAQASEQIRYAAARLYVALVAAINHQRWSGDALAAKPFEDKLRRLTGRYSENELLAEVRVDEFCSLGNAAGVSAEFATACKFLDMAATRFPDQEEPRRLRAKVRIMLKDYPGALDDVMQALTHNARRILELEKQRDAWHEGDRFSRDEDQSRIEALRKRRLDGLDMRVVALLGLGRAAEAREAAKELVENAPENPNGYEKLAVAEELLGDAHAALDHLRQALEREQDPRKRRALGELWQQKGGAKGES